MPLAERIQRVPSTAFADEAFDAAIAAFEAAWQSGDIPDIRAFLDATPLASERGSSLLYELIRVDLEYRWRSDASPAQHGGPFRPTHRIEDYSDLLLQAGGASNLPLDLIAEEYRVRHRWGDRPDTAEFAHRFPERATELAA